jgi:hypothetical protein
VNLETNRRHARARQRALRLLMQQHEQEFRALLENEKAKEGIKVLTSREVIEAARKELAG